jgi:hypothetical protein
MSPRKTVEDIRKSVEIWKAASAIDEEGPAHAAAADRHGGGALLGLP